MIYDYVIVGVKDNKSVKMKMQDDDKFVQVYPDFNKKVKELDKCALRFALYIGETMEDTNQVELTRLFKNRFIEYTDFDYSINTVNASVKKLKAIFFIVPFKTRQHYIVNPLFMFKGALKNRFKIAKMFRTEVMDAYKGQDVEWDLLNTEIRENDEDPIIY